MMAKYIQNGESLDYLNSTDKKILAGEVIRLVTRIGVAGCDIAPGEVGSVEVVGVFEMNKSGKTAIPMGTALFFDGIGVTDAEKSSDDAEERNIPSGYAAASAEADATLIRVKLVG